jgi:putative hydrolase of the HAD superfamily
VEFDAVLFDAGGVLVLPDPTVLAPLLAYYGATDDIEVYCRAHYAAMAAKSLTGAGETEWHDYNHAYVRAVGVPEDHADAAAAVLGRTRNAHLWRWPIVPNITAMRALADTGLPLGVVSNASGQIEETLRRSGVCQVGPGDHVPVRVIIDSHLVGIAKPDPAIFEPALAHFEGMARTSIAYVGDSVTMDVGGALAAGLTPVLLDPHDDHVNHDGLDGVARIKSLADLMT